MSQKSRTPRSISPQLRERERERERSCINSSNHENQEVDRQGDCMETVAHPYHFKVILIKHSNLGQQLITIIEAGDKE